MTTFCGCDTQSLTDLSSVFGERAARLRVLAGGTARSARTVTWIGPDAEDFRERMDEMTERAIGLIEAIRKLGELLGEESEQQTACSEPDPPATRWEDPFGVGAELPWTAEDSDVTPQMSGPDSRGLRPLIGGPIAMKDPLTLGDRLPDLPDLTDLGPMIGGPIMARDPLRPFPPPRPLPEGEEFALDPEHLPGAQRTRRLVLGSIPGVGSLQMLMGVHDAIGRGLDSTEDLLESSGLGFATPLVSGARVPHALAGIGVGEKSLAGQVTGGLDRQFANVSQTLGEVSEAVGDGDWGAAVRAGERGVYRHTDATFDVLTASSAPAALDAGSQMAGYAADLVEPISPAAAAPLRGFEESSGQVYEDLEDLHDRATDGERYYDLRRRYAPMPWDPRE